MVDQRHPVSRAIAMLHDELLLDGLDPAGPHANAIASERLRALYETINSESLVSTARLIACPRAQRMAPVDCPGPAEAPMNGAQSFARKRASHFNETRHHWRRGLNLKTHSRSQDEESGEN